MKKRFFFVIYIAAAFSLFAQSPSGPSIYIENITGSGHTPSDNPFLTEMMIMELQARDFHVVGSPREADYILSGLIQPYDGEGNFLLTFMLRDNSTGVDVLQQTLVYNTVDDVTPLFPMIMFNIISNIPYA